MMKVNEVVTKNMVGLMILSVAVSAGLFLVRPRTATTQTVPVFVSQEVTVNKVVTAEKAGLAAQTIPASIAESVPAPQPNIAAPLPLIPPSVSHKVLPAYPATALKQGLAGTVLLAVYVGLGGQPERVEIKTSTGVSDLDTAAANAVAQWRFSPASQGGQALASWFEVPVRFEVK